MTMSLLNTRVKTINLLDRMNARGDFLLIAFAAIFATLFLSNNYNLPPKLFLALMLPAAFFAGGGLRVQPHRPHVLLSISFDAKITFSMIFVATAIYLVALASWTALQPDVVGRFADQQWLHAAQILLFVLITAQAVARIEGFLVRLMAIVVPIVAMNAFVNAWVFVTTAPQGSLIGSRLVNWLGMPGYTNSTNISVTYALFFVAALAVIFDPGRTRRMRLWLAVPALILVIALLLTQARAAMIGALLGSATIALLSCSRAFRTRHGWKIAAMVIVVAGLIASSVTVRTVVLARGESLRPEIWQTYATKALAQPLKGTGGLANIDIILPGGIIVDQPHNLVLSAQVRGGFVAMLAMVAILLGSLVWAMRYWTLTRSAIPFGMIVTVATTGMFDYNLLITPPTWPWVTFWLPFAVCSGAEMAARSANAGWFAPASAP